MAAMKGTNDRVLFQSADGCINMGVCFNDPDVEIYDIFWLHEIAREIACASYDNKELFSTDQKLLTKSCYVELQRNGNVFKFMITLRYCQYIAT